MEQRRMGNSSLVCSAIGFGTWEMGTTQYGEIDVTEASEAVNAAIDKGINLFDTAAAYGMGRSEVLLGKALGNRRKDIILVTKVGTYRDAQEKMAGMDSGRKHIVPATEDCLRRLGTEWIDLLLLHWNDHTTPAEETIGVFEELKKAGKIREYGVSNYNVAMLEEAEKWGHVAVNQVGYHMFDRRMEASVLPYCLKKEIGFMAYGTLGFGLLTGAFTPETTFVNWDWRSNGEAFGLPLFQQKHFLKELQVVKRLQGLAARYGKTVAQMAIAWVLRDPAVSVALVGIRKPSELVENIEAVSWKLDEEILAEIDRIFADEEVPTHRDYQQMLVPTAMRKFFPHLAPSSLL